MKQHNYYVYIMASINRTLYIGITNDLARRVSEHKSGKIQGFTKKYRCNRLVHYEYYTDVTIAIHREKELKGWKRVRKIELIKIKNNQWNDLSTELANHANTKDPSQSSG